MYPPAHDPSPAFPDPHEPVQETLWRSKTTPPSHPCRRRKIPASAYRCRPSPDRRSCHRHRSSFGDLGFAASRISALNGTMSGSRSFRHVTRSDPEIKRSLDQPQRPLHHMQIFVLPGVEIFSDSFGSSSCRYFHSFGEKKSSAPDSTRILFPINSTPLSGPSSQQASLRENAATKKCYRTGRDLIRCPAVRLRLCSRSG